MSVYCQGQVLAQVRTRHHKAELAGGTVSACSHSMDPGQVLSAGFKITVFPVNGYLCFTVFRLNISIFNRFPSPVNPYQFHLESLCRKCIRTGLRRKRKNQVLAGSQCYIFIHIRICHLAVCFNIKCFDSRIGSIHFESVFTKPTDFHIHHKVSTVPAARIHIPEIGKITTNIIDDIIRIILVINPDVHPTIDIIRV